MSNNRIIEVERPPTGRIILEGGYVQSWLADCGGIIAKGISIIMHYETMRLETKIIIQRVG